MRERPSACGRKVAKSKKSFPMRIAKDVVGLLGIDDSFVEATLKVVKNRGGFRC